MRFEKKKKKIRIRIIFCIIDMMMQFVVLAHSYSSLPATIDAAYTTLTPNYVTHRPVYLLVVRNLKAQTTAPATRTFL